MEVERIIADAKGQRSRCQVGDHGGTSQQDEDEHQGNQLVLPHPMEQIVDNLEDGTEDTFEKQRRRSLSRARSDGSTDDFPLFRCWCRRLLGG